MIEWLKENKWIVGILIFTGAVFIACIIFIPLSEKQKEETEWSIPVEEDQSNELQQDKKENQTEVKMLVDVKGAVNHPGVYEVMEDERVIDVIEKAGGLKEGADEAKVNFAQRVEDEMVLYIPLFGEEATDVTIATGSNEGQATEEGVVNINLATLEELQTLPGIGPSKAQAIITFREENGSYQKIDDLKLVAGIGEKTFEKLQEFIKVN